MQNEPEEQEVEYVDEPQQIQPVKPKKGRQPKKPMSATKKQAVLANLQKGREKRKQLLEEKRKLDYQRQKEFFERKAVKKVTKQIPQYVQQARQYDDEYEDDDYTDDTESEEELMIVPKAKKPPLTRHTAMVPQYEPQEEPKQKKQAKAPKAPKRSVQDDIDDLRNMITGMMKPQKRAPAKRKPANKIIINTAQPVTEKPPRQPKTLAEVDNLLKL